MIKTVKFYDLIRNTQATLTESVDEEIVAVILP